jgi:hypothetical protein
MKRLTAFLLSFSLVAMLSFAATGVAAADPSLSQKTVRMSDTAVNLLIGAHDPGWENFLEGAMCGTGIIVSILTFPANFTGVAAVVWVGLATGTVAACAAATH